MGLHKKHILFIEDDKNLHELIKEIFSPYNIEMDIRIDGNSGLEAAIHNDYDLILLDIMLPDKDGWDVCTEFRQSGCHTPIIMLTAKAEEADRVLGLEIGADDYITKPFSPRELLARAKSVLRRSEKPMQNREYDYYFPNINLGVNTKIQTISVNNRNINLSPKEYHLFVYLIQNKGKAISREELMDRVWNQKEEKSLRTVDEHIKRIRKILLHNGLDYNPIKTVRGLGYEFVS